MLNDISISICIPAYNSFETIEYTILSVVSQSFINWELLVIDDSENELTGIVVNKFSSTDNRVRYKRNEERLGLVKNWNECIRLAQFEYVYILHDDDFLMPNVLNEYNTFLKEYPQCGIVHSNCYYIELPYFKKSKGITQDNTIIQKGDKAVEKILFHNNIACSSVMVKKECYEKLGRFDEDAWVSPDWEMWARIGKNYDIGHLDYIGCVVIINNQNTHFSGIDINEFYQQQKYYFGKIVSYFSPEYRLNHPELNNNTELNLKNTIRGLAIHYAHILKFSASRNYLNKIGEFSWFKFLVLRFKSILRYLLIRAIKGKRSFRQIFESIYLKY